MKTVETTFEYIKNIVVGFWRLMQGMYITMLNMIRPKVTEQYPENRGKKVYPENFRGELIMPHDENNHHKCTACGICMMNCPNGTINVISKTQTDETTGRTRKVLDRHMYNIGSCIFCALCTRTCPEDAIEWTNEFEHSVFTKTTLMKQLNHKGSLLRPKPVATPVAKTTTDGTDQVDSTIAAALTSNKG